MKKGAGIGLLLLVLGQCPGFGQPAYWFADISRTAGVANPAKNRGVAIADYDGDGREDLYVSVWEGDNRLYRNLDGLRFEELGSTAGVAHPGNSWASAWVDYNSDGYPDLYVSNYEAPDVLYRNNGDGTFTDVTLQARIGNIGKPYSVNVADYDRDGRPDIYVANFRSQNALFRNNGDGTFSNYIFPSGALDDQTNAMAALFFDSDLDGDQDLYLIHDGQAYIFYENTGRGNFVDRSAASGLNYQGFGMGVDAGDINRDGYPDLYVSNLYENNLFLNNGDGTFTDIATAAGVADYGMGWGVSFLDFDNDGWLDLYLGNDSWFSPYPNVLYRNKGDLTFEIVEPGSPLSGMQGTYGTGVFDSNRDGHLDIGVANSGSGDVFQLFQNRGGANHWIGFRLEGRESNRMAIGARLRGKDQSGQWHHTQLISGSGFASQSSLVKTWGLGTATQLDSLWIYWPSGREQVITDLSGGTYYIITEGETAVPETGVTVATGTQVLPPSVVIARIYPQPANDELQLEWLAGDVGDDCRVRIADLSGRILRQYQCTASSSCQLDLDGLAPGLYVLELQTTKLRDVQKLVIGR